MRKLRKKIEEKKICPFCNTENGEKSKFCRKCGEKLEEVSAEIPQQNANNSYWEKRFSPEPSAVSGQSEDKVCPTCNTVNSAENKHCKKCGENLQGFSNINWQKIEPVPETKPSENSERLHQILRTEEEKPAETIEPEPEEENSDWGCYLAEICIFVIFIIILVFVGKN